MRVFGRQLVRGATGVRFLKAGTSLRTVKQADFHVRDAGSRSSEFEDLYLFREAKQAYSDRRLRFARAVGLVGVQLQAQPKSMSDADVDRLSRAAARASACHDVGYVVLDLTPSLESESNASHVLDEEERERALSIVTRVAETM